MTDGIGTFLYTTSIHDAKANISEKGYYFSAVDTKNSCLLQFMHHAGK